MLHNIIENLKAVGVVAIIISLFLLGSFIIAASTVIFAILALFFIVKAFFMLKKEDRENKE